MRCHPLKFIPSIGRRSFFSWFTNPRRVLLFAIGMILAGSQAAFAGNTWDGGGANDDWGTGANWDFDSSPSPGSGNDLFFGGSTRLTPNNNYTAFDDWHNITFNSGAGSFNLGGNAIDLFGKIENSSNNTQTVSLGSIALNSATANEFNPVNGDLTINSANVFTNGNTLNVWGDNGHTLTFSAATNIQQTGQLSINQNSTVIFNSGHTYTGDTFVNAGALQFNSGASASTANIRVGATSGSASAKLAIASGATVSNNTVIRPGSSGTKSIESLATSGTATHSGSIYLDAGLTTQSASGGTLAFTGSAFDLKNQTLTIDGSGATTISSVLTNSTGSGKLTKTGAGTATLSSTGLQSYSGATTVNAGTLNVSGLLFNNGSNKVFIAAGDLTSNAPTLSRSVSTGNSSSGFGSAVTSGLLSTADIRVAMAKDMSDLDTGVTMQWRLRDASESASPTSPPLPPGTGPLMSEVIELTGMAVDGSGTGLTRPFTLEMSYDPSLTANEASTYLAWLDPSGTPHWENAVLGNFATGGSAQADVLSSWSAFVSANSITAANLGNFLGSWGVDTTANTVWAVLDHNSQFASVPEPSSLAMMLFGALTMWLLRRKQTV
jgi:autotransporter-associated beta strand protein